MKAIGLDIGTTTICAVLVDANTGEQLDYQTRDNISNIKNYLDIYKLQDPDIILDIIFDLVSYYKKSNADIVSIGVSGQMHGIVYVDKYGNSVSPLFTWQDKRGDLLYKDGFSYAKWIEKQTGYPTSAGFGIVTHFYNEVNDLVPNDASTFCSISDYVALKLSEIKKPLLHQSMAQSFGLYSLEEKCFDKSAIDKIELDYLFLPKIAKQNCILGQTKDDIKVSLAFGDNQASFMGSVNESNCILVNVGTGSQVSICTNKIDTNKDVEYRPFIEDLYLINGSALSGGHSYALLKNFFEQTLAMFSVAINENLYKTMNYEAKKLFLKNNNDLVFDTQFNGTRKNPENRAVIKNLYEENFNPLNFTLSVLEGICEELYQLYVSFNIKPDENTILIGSGNGLKANPLLQEIFAKRFSMNLKMSKYAEEAAYGVALFSLYSTNYYKSLEEIFNL